MRWQRKKLNDDILSGRSVKDIATEYRMKPQSMHVRINRHIRSAGERTRAEFMAREIAELKEEIETLQKEIARLRGLSNKDKIFV